MQFDPATGGMKCPFCGKTQAVAAPAAAPTPSAAAELAVPLLDDLMERVAVARTKAAQGLRYRIAMLDRRLRQQGVDRALGVLHRRIGRNQQRVDELEFRLRERTRVTIESRERARRGLEACVRRFDMRPRLAADRRRLDAATAAAAERMRLLLTARARRMEQLAAKLSQLSPLLVLQRGYAIVSHAGGVVTDAADATTGSQIHVRLAKGELDATVD